MLPKKQRLNRAQFSEYFSSGRRSHTPYLTFIMSPSSTFKAVVVVGKKVAKKAHDRNRLKRRLYSLISEAQKQKNWTGVLLVIAKPALFKLTKRQITEVVGLEIAQVINKT